jgi:hypothetical protein
MRGRSPTAEERRHMSWVANQGCYCCNKLGYDKWVEGTQIHHTDGKTKPYAHFKVIGLCDRHHSRYHNTGLHYNLTAWEKQWGKQEDIVMEIGRE